MTRRKVGWVLAVGVCLLALPSVARAQSAIAGTAKDSSGAVLPGVTVEASSPVLIEGTRSAVTDDQGRYRVVDLRPGVYKLTFTLTGFSTVVREGVRASLVLDGSGRARSATGDVQRDRDIERRATDASFDLELVADAGARDADVEGALDEAIDLAAG